MLPYYSVKLVSLVLLDKLFRIDEFSVRICWHSVVISFNEDVDFRHVGFLAFIIKKVWFDVIN